ncbi:neurofilament medium polypeptide isoform X2 [Xiphophorus hellerii]|uniref:neurofilament medium polypeptide isoform X2 n=1 Tax=Xiphophorus hellerii TaxID=8084 RepID=UPI0013B37757|nr:neurofilament medium polypeptide-like isoform X2 [Xiphophorus hellerii]
MRPAKTQRCLAALKICRRQTQQKEYLLQEKTGGLSGFFKKSPKPSPRSVAAEDPLTKQLSSSWDSLTEAGNDDSASQQKLSASTDDLCDTSSTTREKKARMSGIFRRTPRNTEQQEDEDATPPAGRGLSRKRTIKKKQRVVSFRVKKTLPRMSTEKSSEMPVIEESVEMEELNTPQESTVVVEPVEMAAYPTEESVTQMEQENNELMEWWNSAEGWTEWNETSNFQEEDEQIAMEQAADRVYMAANVFVHLFNQRGASLQHRILELLAMADAADEFHKKTVSAAVGGGVASVAGSVATITGLILAPFTFGASIIVTAVGIGVATAGSITSATANITDTVHSNMDRKKVEKMIQGYQEEIQDIRTCLEFVQEGMNTLEEWDFEKYSESATKKALNHNIKHVMKEGGRAGKALMINTDKLISTVQVLGAAGGAAKAVKAVSVTTGVMSALFLALDIFFLAKDSHTLHKGAKTKFAAKIRQVCKDLQEGLLELNKVKTQLQKTMDGIEVEEYEDVEEVEVEVEDEFESDPKKLAELEQEIDFLEEKLDKKEEEVEPKKSKETTALDIFKIKEKKEEKSMKEKDVEEKREDEEPKKSKESVLDIFKIKKEKKEEKSVEKTGEMEEKKDDEEPKKSKESVLDIFKIKKKEEKIMKEHEVEEKEEEVEPKKSKEVTALDIFKIKKEKKEEKRMKEKDVAEKMEDEEPKKSKESVLDIFKIKKEKKEEKSMKEQEVEEKDKGEKMPESKSEKKVNETSVKAEKDVLKEQFEKGSKKEKETGNQTSPGKKPEKKPEKSKEPNKPQKSKQSLKMSGKKEEEKSQRKTETSRRHSSWSEKDGEKHETRERREERESHPRDRESWRRSGEEETGRKDSHRSHRDEESPRERKTSHHVREIEERSGRVESVRRRFERAAGNQQQEEEKERRRGSGREYGHSRKGSRSKYDALRHDGLNI